MDQTPAPIRIRQAGQDDVEAVAGALGAAFVGDPWIAWIVAADRHQDRITALQVSLITAIGMPHGEVWLAEQDGAVAGGALWLRADRPVPTSAWAQVAAAEASLMGDCHSRAGAAAAATRHLRPVTPHHLLATLGVVAAARGRGIGTALLAPVLDEADAEGVDAYLETSTERNLLFYARRGFEVSGHVVVPDGGPPVWGMTRRAPAPGAGRRPSRAPGSGVRAGREIRGARS